jgi:hypothetical protein
MSEDSVSTKISNMLDGDMENFLAKLWDITARWAEGHEQSVTHAQYIVALTDLGLASDVAHNWVGEWTHERLDEESLANPIQWYS